jgi:hypothetical protein
MVSSESCHLGWRCRVEHLVWTSWNVGNLFFGVELERGSLDERKTLGEFFISPIYSGNQIILLDSLPQIARSHRVSWRRGIDYRGGPEIRSCGASGDTIGSGASCTG